jgi:hypothetical protein
MYRALTGIPVPNEDLGLIRGASQRNQLTGDAHFLDWVKMDHSLDIPARKRGRPRKPPAQKEGASIDAPSRNIDLPL